MALSLYKIFTREKLTYQDMNGLQQWFVDYINNYLQLAADCVSTNTANKAVKRDASGNFSAGTITANLTGNVTGNLTGTVIGNVTGTANEAINSVNADVATTGPNDSVGFYYLINDGPYCGTAITRDQTGNDSNSWLTVGPTGSGCNVIWTALDSLPEGTKGIRINMYADSHHLSAANGALLISGAIRKRGVSTIPDSSVLAYTYSANDISEDHNTPSITLDANKTFEFEWIKGTVSGGTLSLKLYIEGYYI